MSDTGEFRSPYLAVPCPSCGAKVGRWCKRPSGHSGPMVAFHAARRKAAEAQAASVPQVEEPAEEPAKDRAEAAGQGESSALVAPPVPGTLAWAVDTCRRVKAARDGDALCFVRLGDFYESFGQDAVTAAAALDIILTSVPGDGGRVAMTGVPVHVAENYFARLLAQGHRLVVVEPEGAARALTAAVAVVADEAEPLALFLSVPKEAIAGRGVPVQLALF